MVIVSLWCVEPSSTCHTQERVGLVGLVVGIKEEGFGIMTTAHDILGESYDTERLFWGNSNPGPFTLQLKFTLGNKSLSSFKFNILLQKKKKILET